jgi:hypothetical protein
MRRRIQCNLSAWWLHALPCSPRRRQRQNGNVLTILAGASREGSSESSPDSLQRGTPNWRSHRKMAGQGSGDSDSPIALLIEVTFRESRLREPCGEPAVHARPHGFHGIVGEGCTTGGVGMKDDKPRVQPDASERDCHFSRQNGMELIQDGVARRHGITCVFLS